MNDPQTGHFNLDLAVPLERVERIEVLRGPASAVYGANAFSGVVQIITRDGQRVTSSQVTARLEAGSFGSRAVSLDGIGPVGDWRINGGYSNDNSDGHREGTDFTIQRAIVGLNGPLGSGRVYLDMSRADRDFGAAEFYAPFPSYEETQAQMVTARWVGLVTEGLAIEPRISFRKHNDDFVLRRGDPGFYRNVHESKRWMGELLGRVSLFSGGALAVGGEWSREKLESSNLGNREQDIRAVFAEVAVQRSRLSMQGGLRFDARDDVGTLTSPSASVRYRATNRVAFRSSVGRSFRAPTWTDRFYTDPSNQGTSDLEPEEGWSVEVGSEFTLSSKGGTGLLSVTAFVRDTQNLIDWARPLNGDSDDPWRTRNVEEATFKGLEVSFSGISLGRIALHGNASWLSLDTKEAAGFLSKSSLRPLRRILSAGASAPLGGGVSAWFIARSQTRIGGMAGLTMDARIRWQVGGFEIYVDALNLGGQDYLDITDLPIAGRSLSLGVRSRLGG